jgi:hypothetical protein
MSEFVLNLLVELVNTYIRFNLGFKEPHMKKVAAYVLAFAGIYVSTL